MSDIEQPELITQEIPEEPTIKIDDDDDDVVVDLSLIHI